MELYCISKEQRKKYDERYVCLVLPSRMHPVGTYQNAFYARSSLALSTSITAHTVDAEFRPDRQVDRRTGVSTYLRPLPTDR